MKIYAETDRLILREIVDSDLESMFKLDSDPMVVKYLDMSPLETLEEAQKSINYIRKQYVERGVGRWAAVEKSSGDFIGWSGLKHNKGEKESLNGKYNFYDVGYRFIPRYWGKGYATESAMAALDYGFRELEYDTIAGIALIGNIASNKVLQKIGLIHIEDFKYKNTKACWYELNIEDYE